MKKLLFILIFLLAISLPCIAANEIHLGYSVGSTLYFRVFNAAGEVWNTTGTPAFEAWADGNVTEYDVALVGTGGSFFVGTFPATITNGDYFVVSYLRAGGAPAVADGVISGALMLWIDGVELTLSGLTFDLAMPSTQAGRTQR